MKNYRIIILSALLMLLSVNQIVYADQWEFDKAHSSIFFEVQHIYSKVYGNFTDFSGNFKFDPKQLADSQIDITVQTQSINTQITNRDTHLRGKEFFAVSDYPTMTFNSKSISHIKDDKYMVKGDLTIKDVTKSIEVPFIFHGVKNHPLQKGEQVAGFDTKFTLDRLAYHVGNGKFAKLAVVSKDVDVFISLEMLKKE